MHAVWQGRWVEPNFCSIADGTIIHGGIGSPGSRSFSSSVGLMQNGIILIKLCKKSDSATYSSCWQFCGLGILNPLCSKGIMYLGSSVGYGVPPGDKNTHKNNRNERYAQKFLPHKVKMQYLHFRSQAEYFLLSWKFLKWLADYQSSSITKGSIYYIKHNVHTTFKHGSWLTRQWMFNSSIYYVLYL